ncbi:unnamed protein product [Paramecium sonneborni]|uniref:J domain-containing protein n=1 Tax=Paramecium sonneborni TaxID=65129 RepID=A0A8S1KJ45_9CILI|nr:unnamed protein product [Paramecium sonneborni]CAD8055169.1 unnamed protein product [Paramecium sonneborni]
MWHFQVPYQALLKDLFQSFIYINRNLQNLHIFNKNKPINFYEQYKITRRLEQSDLRSAYKRVMLEYHPDRNTQITPEQFNFFKNINEILKQNEARLQFEQFGIVEENNINPQPAILYIEQGQQDYSF